jgi:hypothetical protein
MNATSLLDDVEKFIRRYVVVGDDEFLIMSLWVLHTYVYDIYPQTPYLAITSAEKGCAKTRVLEVLEVLVSKPWRCILPSEALLYRKIDRDKPTLLFDETDTVFSPKTQDRYEGHRAVLNAGNRAGAQVDRMVGISSMESFRVFCPKALAGIGTLPDTVTDRAIPVRMKRKKRSEVVDRFLRRTVNPLAEALREQIEGWLVAVDLDETPDMPEEISDRMQEGCEPLVAIAEWFGVGNDCRSALVKLLTSERVDSVDTMRHRLLSDLRTIWDEAEEEHGKRARFASTTDILNRLHWLPESRWQSYYGRPLEPVDLANLLREYGIVPRPGPKGKKRGYRLSELQDAWDRYLPPDGDA